MDKKINDNDLKKVSGGGPALDGPEPIKTCQNCLASVCKNCSDFNLHFDDLGNYPCAEVSCNKNKFTELTLTMEQYNLIFNDNN